MVLYLHDVTWCPHRCRALANDTPLSYHLVIWFVES